MQSITREDLSAAGTSSAAASEYTCGLDGRVVARDTTKADGSRARRIDFAGVAEIRPDEGIFMLRVPLTGAVTVADARSLSNGARVTAMSGYLVNDARGSVLATTGFLSSSPGFTREAEYDAWGKKVGGYSALSAPRHGFVGAEADEAVGTYSFGARTYDPTLRWRRRRRRRRRLTCRCGSAEGNWLLYEHARERQDVRRQRRPISFADIRPTCGAEDRRQTRGHRARQGTESAGGSQGGVASSRQSWGAEGADESKYWRRARRTTSGITKRAASVKHPGVGQRLRDDVLRGKKSWS